jgi:hypothetical protein
MDGAIVDKIIANFEGEPFDERTGTEPGLITTPGLSGNG